MKKYTTTIALLLTLGVFAFLTHSTSEAQEISGMDKLAEAINRAVDAFTTQDEVINQEMSLQYVKPNPTCLENWDTWPNSFNKKEDTNWAMDKFVGGFYNSYTATTQFLDINGDGLLDYMYFKTYSDSYGRYNNHFACLMLNNGHGWDIGHRCVASFDSAAGQMKYRGDCADMTP